MSILPKLSVMYFEGRHVAVCDDEHWYGDFATKMQAEYFVNAANNYERLKADKAELIDMLDFLGSTSDMRIEIYNEVKELVQKHKGGDK